MEQIKQCFICKSTTTYITPQQQPLWYKDQNYYFCAKCYYKKRRRDNGIFQDFKTKLNQRVCSYCKTDKTQVTITKKGYPHKKWVSDGRDGYLCHKCAKKLLYQEYQLEYTRKQIAYKGKYIRLPFIPRKGQCEWCGNKKGDEYINSHGKIMKTQKIDLHHIEYHDDDVLAKTVEICNSCHSKESARLRKLKKQS